MVSDIIDQELAAMQSVSAALAGLDEDERRRVLTWAGERYGVRVGGSSSGRSQQDGRSGAGSVGDRGANDYEDFAEFFGAAHPSTDAERALLGAAWLSRGERADFQSGEVNKMLKDLGHGIGNITDAFEALIKQKPQLIIQTQKTGTSKQARKMYRLTTTGRDRAAKLLLAETTD